MALTTTATTKAGNGLGSRTTILVTDAAVLNAAAAATIENALTIQGGSITAIAGTADNAGVMHFAVQGGPDVSAYAATVKGQALSAVVTFESDA